jgi:hypothetical protein
MTDSLRQLTTMRARKVRDARAAIAVLVAVVVGAAIAASARAHFQTYPYTLTSCPASYDHQVDPINDVFYGSATAERTLNHIRFHTGWTDTGGSMQSFSSEGVCGEMYGQAASGATWQSRFHIRVKRTYDADATWGVTSRGDAHHEDFVWYCGHAVDKGGVSSGLWSGFDQGRRAIYDAFSGSHEYAGVTYWGNTREFKQCDGDYAGSNGNVGWWRIPDTYH